MDEGTSTELHDLLVGWPKHNSFFLLFPLLYAPFNVFPFGVFRGILFFNLVHEEKYSFVFFV